VQHTTKIEQAKEDMAAKNAEQESLTQQHVLEMQQMASGMLAQRADAKAQVLESQTAHVAELQQVREEMAAQQAHFSEKMSAQQAELSERHQQLALSKNKRALPPPASTPPRASPKQVRWRNKEISAASCVTL
jgi:hypothetical protein